MASSADSNDGDDLILITKIKTFVSENVSQSIPRPLFRDLASKKEVERVVAEKFFEFISENRSDIISGCLDYLFWFRTPMLIDIVVSKNMNSRLPRVFIPCIPIYDIHPNQLIVYQPPAGFKQWFVFALLKGDKPGRQCQQGYWDAFKANDQVTCENGVQGEIRYLEFYEGAARPGIRTDWRLSEYGLLQPDENSRWVLCRVGRLGTGPNNIRNRAPPPDGGDAGEFQPGDLLSETGSQ